MAFFAFLALVSGIGWFVSARLFKVPDGAIARRGTNLYLSDGLFQGWHFSLAPKSLEYFELDSRIVSVSHDAIPIRDGSELHLTLAITWTPNRKNLPAYLTQEVPNIEARIKACAVSTLLKWGMDDDGARSLRKALSSQRKAEDAVKNQLYEIAYPLGVWVNRVEITDIRATTRPRPDVWGEEDTDIASIARSRIKSFADLDRVCSDLKKEFPDRIDDIEDFQESERIRLKEKPRM